jgi:hypothetical protein
MTLLNSLIGLTWGGKVPSSQTVGSLVRTPWLADPAGKIDLPEKWIWQSHNLMKGVLTKQFC